MSVLRGRGRSHTKFLHPKLKTSTGFRAGFGTRVLNTINVVLSVHEAESSTL